jgi:Carbamoyltransferase N-terminus
LIRSDGCRPKEGSDAEHSLDLGFYHDSATCLVKDGEVIAAAQEERFTRKEHEARFVAFYDKPLLKFARRGPAMRARTAKGPPRGGSTEDLPELLLRRLQPGALPAGKRASGAVRVQVEHGHGGLKLGALRPSTLEDGPLEASRDAGWRALEDARWEIHGVGGLPDLADP